MQELLFLRSARRLMLIDIYMKFREDSLNCFQVIERTCFVTDNVPREITQKVKMQELLFLRSARRLMLIDIYMKFREDGLNGFQVIERTRYFDRVQGK